VLGSIIAFRRNAPVGAPADGIEALKGAAVHRAFGRSIRYWRSNWRTEARNLMAGRQVDRNLREIQNPGGEGAKPGDGGTKPGAGGART
jgi:hypothetical protein